MVNLLQVNGLRDTVAAQRLRYGGARVERGNTRGSRAPLRFVVGPLGDGRARQRGPCASVDLLVVTLKNLI